MISAEQQIAELHRAAQKALQQGKLREVHQLCLSILNIDTSFADAWFLCAVIAAHNGQVAKAVDILQKCIELAPQNPEYRTELAKHLVTLDLPERALEQAQIALALQPTAPPVLNTLGTVLSHTGEHETALRCFEDAARGLQSRSKHHAGLTPEWQANLFFNLGASLQFAGHQSRAEQAYEKAIERQPRMCKAHSALATTQRYSSDNNHLTRLYALRDTVTNARDRLHVGHAIAKEQEDMGQYQQAFASLEWAKQGQAANVRYRGDADAQYFAQLMQLFTRERLSAAQPGHSNSEAIFIVGMPRTGTTLVEQILSSHSQVYAAGELQNLPLQIQRATGSPQRELPDIATLTQALDLDLAQLGSAYIDSTRPRTGATAHFIDKLPLNFLLLGLIKMALPNAKFICLRRDPMDTCLSNYRQLFAVDFKPYHYNYNLLDCGRYYILFDQLMRHWQNVMPGAVLEVHYEALVANPDQVSQALLAHCGLDWEEQCRHFHQATASVATPSAAQVKQPIYSSSINRWQQYGDAMQPLLNLLKAAGCYA